MLLSWYQLRYYYALCKYRSRALALKYPAHFSVSQHEAKLERAEMRMIRMMCGVSLRDKITNVMLRERMGVEAIGVVVKRNRLRWFGHVVERKDDCDWVKGCTFLEVQGPKPRGRPKKTWMKV